MSQRRRAQISLLISAAAFSTAGLFVGLLDIDAWTILFWRSLFALAFTLLWVLCQADVHASFRLDRSGLAAAVLSAAATLLFIPALKLTSVANVALIHGSLPLLTAALAGLITREPVNGLTFGLCAAGAFGALVIFAGSASSSTSLSGDCLAFLMTGSMALMTVAFRQSKSRSVLGAVAVSHAIATLLAAGFMPKQAIPLEALAILASFALFQMTLGLILFAWGARVLRPAETAILSLAEVPLSPLWVWLAFGAQPPNQTIAAGGLILTAVLVHLFAVRSPASAPNRQRANLKE